MIGELLYKVLNQMLRIKNVPFVKVLLINVVIANSVDKEEDLTQLCSQSGRICIYRPRLLHNKPRVGGTSRITSYLCAGVAKNQREAQGFLPSPMSYPGFPSVELFQSFNWRYSALQSLIE